MTIKYEVSSDDHALIQERIDAGEDYSDILDFYEPIEIDDATGEAVDNCGLSVGGAITIALSGGFI